jgi:pyruvate dehydrogenase E2 component (dihydrolipoamide acetyltransferase)
MANQVLLPQMGISEESAVIGEFFVKVGDPVQVGSKLFSEETGKSVFDVESEFEGVVLAILCEEGDELPIKAPVMVIGQAGETYAAPQAAAAPEKKEEPAAVQEAPAQKAAEIPVAAAPMAAAHNALVSPRARALAEKAGIDPALAQPTGAEGMIIERDVKAMLDAGIAAKPATVSASAPVSAPVAAFAPEYKDVPLTTMRRTIAKTMLGSLQSMAQLTHTASFDATDVLAYRQKCKGQDSTKGITLGDMVVYAVTRTLKSFPEMNAYLMEKSIRQFSGVHLAVAVDIPAGLVVPVIRDADKLSLLQISQESKRLVEACRNGSIAPDLLTGGTFTVSNLGNLGIESFTPIINPPQVGILGVNTITLRPRRAPNGTVSYYDCMTLSLTYDHRAIDGAPASRFLQALCQNLESFTLLLGGAQA